MALYPEIVEQRDRGPDARRALHARLQVMLDRHGESAPVCVGRLQEHVAFLYVLDERYVELADWLDTYLAGPGHHTSVRSQLMLETQRGYALRKIGRRLEGARSAYRAASLADRAPAANGAKALITAGTVSRTLGEEAAAVAYFESALRLIADSLDTDPALLDLRGHAFSSLSILIDYQVLRAGAGAERDSLIGLLESYTAEALAVLSSDGAAAGNRAFVSNLSALAAAWRGDYALARERARPSRKLAERAGPMMPFAMYDTYLTEGRLAEAAGDSSEAEQGYQRARAEAVDRQSSSLEADALEHLGRLLEKQRRWDEAAGAYTAAIDRRELFRDRLGLDDWSSSTFANAQAPYRGLVRVRLAQGDAAGAFAVLDQTRARYLRDLRQHQDVRTHLTDDARAAVDSVSTQLSDARLAALSTSTVTEQAALRRRVSELQGQRARLTRSSPTGGDHRGIDLDALRRTLGDQRRTLVAYVIDDESGTAFVVRADTLVAIPLPATRSSVRRQLGAVGSPWGGRAPDPAFSLRALHDLYQDLVAPIRGWVLTDAVTIVPDAELATAPFAAFITTPADDFETAPYLLYDWTISTELAASLVGPRPSPTDKSVDVLAFGRTTFEAERSTWNTLGLEDLPNVGEEVSRITRRGKSVGYREEQATEAVFRKRAEQAHVVHIASHAEVRPELPLYSRIALSPGEGEDGVLHLYEILTANVNADLVVLSGCSTADGGRRDGEGLIGLQYGMRASGSGATLATLWPVADQATTELMGSFYDGLNRGLRKDEALRQAQLAYVASHRGVSASPFFWAAPVLSGSPAPVPFRSRSRWWLVAVGAALAGGLAWRLRPHCTDD